MTPEGPGRDRAAAVRHAQRVSGQVGALSGMVAAGRPFPDIAQQLLAARGSLDSLLVRLVRLELGDCALSQEARHEVDDLLRAALGRAAFGRNATGFRQPGQRAVPTARPTRERTVT